MSSHDDARFSFEHRPFHRLFTRNRRADWTPLPPKVQWRGDSSHPAPRPHSAHLSLGLITLLPGTPHHRLPSFSRLRRVATTRKGIAYVVLLWLRQYLALRFNRRIPPILAENEKHRHQSTQSMELSRQRSPGCF